MATAPPITGSADTESSTATRILDVAEQLFAERGFAAVSVREIAGRVSLNQASIYNHFSSKQALYEAVLERGFAPIRLLLERGAAELDGAEAGDDFLESLVDQLWQTPNLPKLLQREILDDGPYLERLAEQWLRPIVVAGRDAMGGCGSGAARELGRARHPVRHPRHVRFSLRALRFGCSHAPRAGRRPVLR